MWMETSAALTGDENSERRDRYVICVNYVVRFVLYVAVGDMYRNYVITLSWCKKQSLKRTLPFCLFWEQMFSLAHAISCPWNLELLWIYFC